MTPKERAAMQQALEALRNVGNTVKYLIVGNSMSQMYGEMRDKAVNEANKAITALREALAEQAEQEPVAWVGKGGFNTCGEGQPLYAAHVRTKDLTDKQIEKVWNKNGGYMGMPIDFARGVIAADREKNNPLTKSNKGE